MFLTLVVVVLSLAPADRPFYQPVDHAAAQEEEVAEGPFSVELVGRLTEASFGVAISGSYAYVPTFSRINIVDISNPAGPVVAARYPLLNATRVLLYGQYAYVITDMSGLHILDISARLEPTEVGFYPSPPGGTNALSLRFPYLYIGGDGVRVINVSDPTRPIEVGSYRRPEAAWGVDSLVVAGNYVYASGPDTDGPTRGQGGMRVIDVSNPSSPREVAYYPTSAVGTTELVINGSRAYLLAIPGLHIVDIKDPTNPVGLATYSLGFDPGRVLAVSGRYAYLVTISGLRVVDISNPASPAQVAIYATRASTTFGITLAGLLIYLSDSEKGISILRFSDAAAGLEARHFMPLIMAGNAGP